MRSVRTNYIIIMIRVIGLMVLLLLSACHRSHYVPDEDDPKLPCKVQGACDSTIMKYFTKLNKSGIKVVTIGQDYLISIPASALFDDQTPHIKWSSYGLLNEISTFLKQFRKVAITVTSYSSKYVSVQRERALTMARSRVVAEYLWSQGIDSRFIFTQGLGSDKPIASFNQGGDKSPNARVEITFRRAVVN
ncbi:protein LphA [Legionella sp. km535]|uniref:type IVB secretion system protein IcmN/DotK n=1 Tax=Legionella sp. km535 TaxID=2498107 RepID=UPI000F8D7FC5|nr:type IVB secretion system protein IcmN/DotK [Legionella sp. km535]RUR20060.1 protein LphA [Legionella sp. km535]